MLNCRQKKWNGKILYKSLLSRQSDIKPDNKKPFFTLKLEKEQNKLKSRQRDWNFFSDCLCDGVAWVAWYIHRLFCVMEMFLGKLYCGLKRFLRH